MDSLCPHIGSDVDWSVRHCGTIAPFRYVNLHTPGTTRYLQAALLIHVPTLDMYGWRNMLILLR